jgi:hypothetical protein
LKRRRRLVARLRMRLGPLRAAVAVAWHDDEEQSRSDRLHAAVSRWLTKRWAFEHAIYADRPLT